MGWRDLLPRSSQGRKLGSSINDLGKGISADIADIALQEDKLCSSSLYKNSLNSYSKDAESAKYAKPHEVIQLTELTQPSGVCWACGSSRYWLSIHDALICARCHPPAHTSVVQEWLEVSR